MRIKKEVVTVIHISDVFLYLYSMTDLLLMAGHFPLMVIAQRKLNAPNLPLLPCMDHIRYSRCVTSLLWLLGEDSLKIISMLFLMCCACFTLN